MRTPIGLPERHERPEGMMDEEEVIGNDLGHIPKHHPIPEGFGYALGMGHASIPIERIRIRRRPRHDGS